jgi:lariat debranching enzyme
VRFSGLSTFPWDTSDTFQLSWTEPVADSIEAIRSAADLTVMSVPAKYRKLGDFHEYYSGVRVARCLAIFVGGNHESSSYLRELYFGGWVAPNIYYMGAANVVRLGPLPIAGISGIWSGSHYRMPHTERLPFSRDDKKSFYHTRDIDIRKLLQVHTQVDIGIIHDWPRTIEKYRGHGTLFNMKQHFDRGSSHGSLGNPAADGVMDRTRPPYWFSGHMHCKFLAIKTYATPMGEANKPTVTICGRQKVVSDKDEVATSPYESVLFVNDGGRHKGLEEIFHSIKAARWQRQ